MTDFAGLLACLVDAKVDFILVGGAAATAHGASRLTVDVDVVYGRSRDNLIKLAAALAPHRPYLRGAPAGLPFVFDLATLQHGLNFTLVTALGDLVLLGEITGGGGYEALKSHAIELTVFGRAVPCLGIRKLIDVKRAAGRPKDLEAIAELEILASELGE